MGQGIRGILTTSSGLEAYFEVVGVEDKA